MGQFLTKCNLPSNDSFNPAFWKKEPIVTAIFFGYLAISYSFSGLFCYLAFQKNANKQLDSTELQRQPVPLKSFALTLLWPLWMVRESFGNNNWQDDRIYLLEPQNVCSEVGKMKVKIMKIDG